jgi:hypothetical protein
MSDDPLQTEFERAERDVYGSSERKDRSIYKFAFLAHHYAGERSLENSGQLAFFRKTQRLSDYRKAEEGVKRGWARWMKLRWGITPKDAADPFKTDQFRLLEQLRRAHSDSARQKELQRGADLCRESAARSDLDFFRRLANALTSECKPADDEFLFVQAVLANWLTGFWWLMPLKAVANAMAEIEGQPGLGQKYYARLRKLKSRDGKGGFFSSGWRGVFHSARPPLIGSVENNGQAVFTVAGRRLLL